MTQAKHAEELLDRLAAQVTQTEAMIVEPPAEMGHQAHQLDRAVLRVTASPQHLQDAVPKRSQRTVNPYSHHCLLSFDEEKSLRQNSR